jgi:hypothetical protein
VHHRGDRDDIEPVVLERQCVGVRAVKGDAEAGAAGLPARDRKHRLGDVDADDRAPGLRSAPARNGLRARAAADVQHSHSRSDPREIEQILPIGTLAPSREYPEQQIVEPGKADAAARICATCDGHRVADTVAMRSSMILDA